MKDELIIEKLTALAVQELGDGEAVRNTIAFLCEHTGITRISARRALIGKLFFKEYTNSKRTARDIEEELAVRFELTRDQVKNIRIEYVQSSSRRKGR